MVVELPELMTNGNLLVCVYVAGADECTNSSKFTVYVLIVYILAYIYIYIPMLTRKHASKLAFQMSRWYGFIL